MSTKQEIKIQGLPISKGVICAAVCLLDDNKHTQSSCARILPEKIAAEKEKLAAAIKQVALKFDNLQKQVTDKIGKGEAEIFSALKSMLTDPMVNEKLFSSIQEKLCSAESAVFLVFDDFISQFKSIDDKYIKERITDITDIKHHLLNELTSETTGFKCKGASACSHGVNRIIVAEELTPSTTCSIDVDSTLGFISERGGRTSHAAILARALGVPAVSGIPDVYKKIPCGTETLINGYTGEVVIWPTEKTKKLVFDKFPKKTAEILSSKPIEGFSVMANISSVKDVYKALEFNADGVGLYRTEMEFITDEAVLTENEQYNRYAEVVKAMKGKTVFFRLLDLGGDKELPFLNIQKELNPQLGCRGVRFLKTRPDLLAAQARAIARASAHGSVGVIYPMIVSLEQFLEIRKMFDDAVADIKKGEILHGPMFEVPSACFIADDLFKNSNFASVGTNDLVQYLFAIDRCNEQLAEEYNPDHQILWNILRLINEAAKKNNKPVSICGEIAGDKKFIPKLIDVGFKNFGVPVPSIPAVRNKINELIVKYKEKK